MVWQVPKIWQGGDVWIIGGGTSIIKQFQIPEKVVEEVYSKQKPLSVYTNYMQSIKGKHVIGVNVAYMLGSWIDMAFFGDNGFFLKHQKGLLNFPKTKVSCNPMVAKYDWVKYLPKDKQHILGVSRNPRLVSWNNNSGAAAINLAVHTGAKRIFLLGFDMDLDANNNQHWHKEYGNAEKNKHEVVTNIPFNIHLRSFPFIAKDCKEMGVEVINVNPNSKIDSFLKVDIKELI